MPSLKVFKEYQTLLVERLRSIDRNRAGGDPVRLRNLDAMSDAEVMKKWLWTISIAGAPICFLVVPLVVSLLCMFVPVSIMGALWFVARCAMGIVLIVFCLAIYFTVRAQ